MTNCSIGLLYHYVNTTMGDIHTLVITPQFYYIKVGCKRVLNTRLCYHDHDGIKTMGLGF